MRDNFRGLLSASLILLLFRTVPLAGQAAVIDPATLPVSRIEPGMLGVGRTVFKGDSIEEFQVRIIGTLKNFLPKKDIILAELMGDRLKYTGVIGGMSGSPIYIDGKLIGALAYGWSYAKDPVFGITPIAQMLEIESDVRAQGALAPQSGAAAGRTEGVPNYYSLFDPPKDMLADEAPQEPRPAAGGGSLTRLEVPLIFSGCQPGVVERYGKIFARFGLVPLMGGSAGGAGDSLEASRNFEAGSAVSAQLIRGDLSLAATGTLTWRDENRILAFGHPFLQFGPVDFPMTAADIVTVLPNVERSFKISNSTAFIGSIKADQSNGIYGLVGSEPRMIPLEIGLSLPGNRKESFHYEMVRHKLLTPVLGALSLINSIQSVGNSGSEQTFDLDARIEVRGREPVVIQNMYAGSQGSGMVTRDLQTVLQYLYSNFYGPADIGDMRLSLEVKDGFPNALIREVYLDRSSVYPGDTLQIDVLLDPFNGPRFKVPFKVVIPQDETENNLFILVGGAEPITRTEFQLSPGRFMYTSLDHLIRLINETRKNNCLYVKVFRMDKGLILGGHEMPGLPSSTWAMLSSEKSAGATLPLNDLSLAEFEKPTGYIISGFKVLPVELKERE